MIFGEVEVCPNCGGELHYYDTVKRKLRTKYGKRVFVPVKRYRCKPCHSLHRQLNNDILPYRRYEAEVIRGVVEGFITPCTIGFEDYPAEITMIRWIAYFHASHSI